MSMRVAVPLVVFLLISQIGVVSEVIINEAGENSETVLSSVSIDNIVEDPYFAAEPETVVEGTSGEFSSNHHQAVGEEDFNYMELTWDHTANTSLDFRIEDDENLPPCLEFIYFYQEFDWPLNERPLTAKGQFNFSTTLTGSFATEEGGNLMFRVHVWMIDSSGNWLQVYESRDATYSEIYRERRISLSYFDLQEIWGGVIENSSGLQEDPEDIVQIAVGLAPTKRFETYFAYEDDPWEFYEGSVSVRIKSMELYVYMEEDPDPSQVLSPIHNSIWEYSVNDVFPDILEQYETAERFRDIETDSDGSVYVLCDSLSSYDFSILEGKSYGRNII